MAFNVQLNPKLVGAGVAAAIAAGLGYALLSAQDDEAAGFRERRHFRGDHADVQGHAGGVYNSARR